MKRTLWLVVAVQAAMLVFGHVWFGGHREASSALRVALVFDVGGKDDKSFNESAWRGAQRAELELGLTVQTVEPGDGSDREAALRQFAAAGYDLVIGVGFIFSGDLAKLAADYPATKFACIDYSPGMPSLPNLAGIRFREQEGSFLAGAAAGLRSRSRVVGFVGGMKIPLIEKFEAGYRAGVHATCPQCQVKVAYAGAEPKAFADPTLGYELAQSQLSAGADVVFHAAGKTGDGVIAAVADRRALAIGVDSDQYALAPCCVMTSMLKRVDQAVFSLLAELHQGRFAGGIHELGLREGGVAILADSRNVELLPFDARQRLDELTAELIAGNVVVPTTPGGAPSPR